MEPGQLQGRKRPTILTLPAEIREQIFEYSFQHSNGKLVADLSNQRREPLEPPITRVSRQFREESIPLFYNQYPFTIQAYVKVDSFGNKWLTIIDSHHRLSVEKINALRRLKLRYGFLERYFGEPVTIEFTVILNKRGTHLIKHAFGTGGWYSDANRKGDPMDCLDVVNLLQRHIEKSISDLAVHPGVGRLTAMDLDHIISFDPDTLP